MKLLEELPLLAWVATPEGKIVYANRACANYTGLELNEDNQKSWASIIHPADLQLVVDRWNEAIQRKNIFTCEYRLRGIRGDFRWFLIRVVPVQNDAGDITEWLGSATDIHETKIAHEELKSARLQIENERQQLRLALETAELGTCQVDWASGDVSWDAQHAKIFGFPAEAMTLTMEEFATCLHPKIRDQVVNELQTCMQTQKHIYQGEWQLRLPFSEEPRFVKCLTRFEYDGCGHCVRAQGLVSDITAQKSVTDKLVKATKESNFANQAKSRFLANMSHEIRTPVGVVLGYTDLALESASLDAETRSYLQAARSNGEALKKLIGDLLDLSKIESEKMDLEILDVDLPHLIDDVVSSLQVRAREKSLHLRTDLAPDLPRHIWADPTAIRQILTNLITNAIKFTPCGGIDISVTEEELADQKLRVRFRVRDTGIGVSEKNVSRLFRPFSQADSSTSRKYSGTGLGLVISRKLSRLMQGDVFLVETSQGHGSLFEFHFITKTATSVPEIAPTERVSKAAPLPLQGCRILIVEDSPDNRELLALYLKRAGAKVEVAEDGVKGVEQALHSTPDAVLMDIQMPVMDGYEAHRQLRKSNFEKPVIALTAHALKSERDRALSEGFTSYLTKPVDRGLLVSTLAKLIRLEKLH